MAADRYSSLAALKAELREHVDYRLRVLKRKSWATIISPHGGYIEGGSSAIARAIAGRNYNLYDFQGLWKENEDALHVTSTRFEDPVLTELLKSSDTAISIHGMGNNQKPEIWLGGLNKALKDIVLEHLLKANFVVNPNSPKYRGESPKNIVNIPSQKGVQLELSNELRAELFGEQFFLESGKKPKIKPKFYQLVSALRKALFSYRKLDLATTYTQ